MVFKQNDVTYLCFVLLALTTRKQTPPVYYWWGKNHSINSIAWVMWFVWTFPLNHLLLWKSVYFLGAYVVLATVVFRNCTTPWWNLAVLTAVCICLNCYFKMGRSPHLMGGEDSHLLQGSDFGAVIIRNTGALRFPSTMQRSLTSLNCTKVLCQI